VAGSLCSFSSRHALQVSTSTGTTTAGLHGLCKHGIGCAELPLSGGLDEQSE
jgi:hypothetical protein